MIKKGRSETDLIRSKKGRSETDLITIKEKTIGNRSEQSHDHYLTLRGKDN